MPLPQELLLRLKAVYVGGAILAIFQARFRVHRDIYHFLGAYQVLGAPLTTCLEEDLTSCSPVRASGAILPALLPPLSLCTFVHWTPLPSTSDGWSA